MNNPYSAPNTSVANPIGFDVKEQDFGDDEKGIPVAGKYSVPYDTGGGKKNAIGEYLIPPNSGTYVLGSVNGAIQWIATESCD